MMCPPSATLLVGILIILIALWKTGCACLRKRRAKLIASLDPERDSHTILACTLFVEFPFLFERAFEFGVLRSIGIPAISRTVKKVFAGNTSKRYDDTDILIREMLLHHVDSPRGSLAVRRLNFLHSQYRVLNEEYLYLLAIVTVSPIEWAAKYGHREWTQLEKSTYYKVWHDIAIRMGIHSIPKSIEDMILYKKEFEEKHMVYAKSNHEVAELSLKLLETKVPTILRPLSRKMLLSLIDNHLLASLGYPRQPPWLCFFSNSLLKLHGFFVTWMPPRPFSWVRTRISPHFYGCPFLHHESTLPLAFQCYKPFSYEKGYKITELGSLKSGKIVEAFEGKILCPKFEEYNPLPPWLKNELFSST